ncbi:MAG: leucine-rich repeat domain-containing protein [Candidatus Coproplasma sp.]
MKKLLSIALAAASVATCIAFAGCDMGEAIVNYTLSEDGTYYIVSSVTGNKNALKSYEIPSTYSEQEGGEQLPVTVIADQAFYQCTSLKSITIPDTVTTIGNAAFAMSGIVSIDIPDSVETIGYSAFGLCNYLEEIVIPANVTSLGDRAFVRCPHLRRAEVYANITDLKYETFYNSLGSSGGETLVDSELTEVVLSASIKKICVSALSGNIISDIYFMGSEEQWDELYFYTFTTNDKGESEEKKVEKSAIVPSTTIIHFDYVPEK